MCKAYGAHGIGSHRLGVRRLRDLDLQQCVQLHASWHVLQHSEHGAARCQPRPTTLLVQRASDPCSRAGGKSGEGGPQCSTMRAPHSIKSFVMGVIAFASKQRL